MDDLGPDPPRRAVESLNIDPNSVDVDVVDFGPKYVGQIWSSSRQQLPKFAEFGTPSAGIAPNQAGRASTWIVSGDSVESGRHGSEIGRNRTRIGASSAEFGPESDSLARCRLELLFVLSCKLPRMIDGGAGWPRQLVLRRRSATTTRKHKHNKKDPEVARVWQSRPASQLVRDPQNRLRGKLPSLSRQSPNTPMGQSHVGAPRAGLVVHGRLAERAAAAAQELRAVGALLAGPRREDELAADLVLYVAQRQEVLVEDRHEVRGLGVWRCLGVCPAGRLREVRCRRHEVLQARSCATSQRRNRSLQGLPRQGSLEEGPPPLSSSRAYVSSPVRLPHGPSKL